MTGTHSRITLREESVLARYFCHWQCYFQRSAHGPMTEHLERASMGSRKCYVCGGCGIVETTKAILKHSSLHKGIVSTRRETATKIDGVWTTERTIETRPVRLGDDCRVCNGTGFLPAKRDRPRCECWGQSNHVRAVCSVCFGSGIPRITARPVHTTKEANGVELNGDSLQICAVVSRRLSKISEIDRSTLERYYGPHGQSWAQEPHGRILGLEEFTTAGKKLLERTKTAGDDTTGASCSERIAAQRSLQQITPIRWRGLLLEKAREQALAMLHKAQQSYAQSMTPTWEEAFQTLLDNIDATGNKYERWIDRNWEDGVCLSGKEK